MFYFRVAATAYSFRKEIGIVLGVLAVLIILPIFAVLGLMTNGVQSASDALVEVNPETHEVIVRDVNGNILTKFQATTTWMLKGVVTQEFGNPNYPYQARHSGIDISGGHGTPITVFMAGKVSKVGDFLPGCGSHCVEVDHGNKITSTYAHMSAHSVKVGQDVKPGDVIGHEGEEGWAHGSHLHFEVKVAGILVNPRTFLIGNPQRKD